MAPGRRARFYTQTMAGGGVTNSVGVAQRISGHKVASGHVTIPASLNMSGRLTARKIVEPGAGEHAVPADRHVIERATWYLACAETGERIVGQLARTDRATFAIGSIAGLAVADIVWRCVRRR
jgi:hypothetical protein